VKRSRTTKQINPDGIVNAAVTEFMEHIGNAHLSLRQKRLAMKGLMHICLPHLGDIRPTTDLRFMSVIFEWSYLRAPCERDFPIECLGKLLLFVGEQHR